MLNVQCFRINSQKMGSCYMCMWRFHCICISKVFQLLLSTHPCSYLTEMIPLFIESAEQFVKKLMPFASSKKQVMMRDQMYEMALVTIFKVSLNAMYMSIHTL